MIRSFGVSAMPGRRRRPKIHEATQSRKMSPWSIAASAEGRE